MKIELIPSYLLQLDHCLKLIDYMDKRMLNSKDKASKIYFHSILTRSADYVSAFKLLIKGDNYMSSGVILRCHLDSLLKIYAFTLIDDKGEFLNKMLNGKQISDIKLKNGQKLSERFLNRELSKEHP